MNVSGLIATLSNGVTFAKQFVPLATQLGGPSVGMALKLSETLIEVASNVSERIKQGTLVASSHDEAALRIVLADLAATNDKLAASIAAS